MIQELNFSSLSLTKTPYVPILIIEKSSSIFPFFLFFFLSCRKKRVLKKGPLSSEMDNKNPPSRGLAFRSFIEKKRSGGLIVRVQRALEVD